MNVKHAQEELLQLQTGSDIIDSDNQNYSQTVERNRYEGTAFDITGNKEVGYFVALGQYRLTQPTTKEKCAEMIDNRDYELLLGLMGATLLSHNQEILDKIEALDNIIKDNANV